MKYIISTAFLWFLLSSCGGSSTYVDVNKLPDTYQCSHMKDICKEAREFENNYSQMSKEEQEEFKTLLETYRNQCNSALEECKKSGK